MNIGALTEFHYVRVISINGASGQVFLIDPDAADEAFGEDIDLVLL
ncbi:hypothetical protein PI125_g15861 [Phytophthora idaei]|nr:hypothetical protein PI125_g15861 [Phytophthora idaei]